MFLFLFSPPAPRSLLGRHWAKAAERKDRFLNGPSVTSPPVQPFDKKGRPRDVLWKLAPRRRRNGARNPSA